MLKNIKSKRKLLAGKKNMQSDMEEELKRLRFFQNTLKVNILNMKAKEQITKCELLQVKRCIESVSKRIAPKTNVSKLIESFNQFTYKYFDLVLVQIEFFMNEELSNGLKVSHMLF